VPIFVCLRSSCNRVGGRRALGFVRLALNVVLQNDEDFVHVILLYDKEIPALTWLIQSTRSHTTSL
jgi:hypothetical protein